jgi:hypothetical protein
LFRLSPDLESPGAAEEGHEAPHVPDQYEVLVHTCAVAGVAPDAAVLRIADDETQEGVSISNLTDTGEWMRSN